MMLTDLASVLRAGGLDVVEVPGWKDRGHGPMSSVDGVTCHHTASGRGTGTTLGLSTVRDGRAGLPGPLAHLYLNRAGTFYVVAAGLCYHAGVSLKTTYENPHRIGIEALAAGDGWAQDWPDEQLDAYALGCRVLALHYKFDITDVRGHKETCSPPGRKIDPSFDMTKFRTRVRNAQTAQEAEMAAPSIGEIRAMIREELTRDETVEVLAQKLFSADAVEAPESAKVANPQNTKWQLRSYLNGIYEATRPDKTNPTR